MTGDNLKETPATFGGLKARPVKAQGEALGLDARRTAAL